MSTSFICHAFGMPGYEYVHQKFVGGSIILRVRPQYSLMRCPACGLDKIIRRGMCLRKLGTVLVGMKAVWLEVEIPGIFCARCNCVRQIDTKIARPRKSHTRHFARYVITLSKMMTLKDIALLLGTGWDTVKNIVKENLRKRFSHPSLKGVRHLAIDEISSRKGHKYIVEP